MEIGSDLTALVFDFDGTLFHLDVDWAGLRADLGVTGRLGDAVQRWALAGDPRLDLVTAAELAGVGDRRVDAGTAATLEALAGRYALAVCTRNSARAVRRAFDGVPVGPRLEVVGREDCRRLKPDPASVRLALHRLGATPQMAALVGDTDHDVRAARSAGLRAIVVRNERLAHPPEGADYAVDRLADLVPLLLPEGTP